jgi:2-iminobutanoate/2-iminopropanoate deaminase
VLESEGSGMSDIVEVTVFLADMNDFQAMNKVYAGFFSEPYPARAAVQAAALPKNALVEIKVTAVV